MEGNRRAGVLSQLLVLNIQEKYKETPMTHGTPELQLQAIPSFTPVDFIRRMKLSYWRRILGRPINRQQVPTELSVMGTTIRFVSISAVCIFCTHSWWCLNCSLLKLMYMASDYYFFFVYLVFCNNLYHYVSASMQLIESNQPVVALHSSKGNKK